MAVVSSPVTYELTGKIATVTMDDGKVNVFSIPMLEALHEAFDQAERDDAIVILTGRAGYFSAGFDLKVFSEDQANVLKMLTLGATLAERLLAFPTPTIAACSGHAYPAGAFLLMSADLRIGAEGPYNIGTNEVRIGLTMPWFAVEIARHRLIPPYFDRCMITSAMCRPQEAVTAGFLDRVVAPEDLASVSRLAAEELAQLDFTAHLETKLRVRAQVRTALRRAIETELK
jgi:enoyl-CoA hydratase